MTPTDPATIRDRVLASRRYRWVAATVVERLAADELSKARTLDDAVKRTKRRLHQVFGAYASPIPYDRVLADMERATVAGDAERIEALCRRTMQQHASTRERMPLLDRFYQAVFARTGPPASLLDLACGLNPLAVPWMGLPPDCRYRACDIDTRLAAFLARFLELAGVRAEVEVRDALGGLPDEPVDVALLLKALPCLERQQNGAARTVLDAVRARHVVVTYPTRSLGGAYKGMERTYREQFGELASGRDWRVDEIVFPGELVFVIHTTAEPAP